MGEQHEILALPLRGGTILPGEIAARADVEELAQACDREVLLRRIDEAEPHRLPSLAKKAVVGSTGRRNGYGEGSAWCSEAKGLSRARVEFEGHGIEVGLTVS